MHVVNVDGRTVRALTAGDRADTPLLLLHGIGRSLEDWTEQIERLSGRFYVIAVDLPGFGRSSRRDGPADLATVAYGVAGALAAMPLSPDLATLGSTLQQLRQQRAAR